MNLSETYNLKVLYPEIARQWHPLKNGNLTPDKVTPGSKKEIWWVCHKRHEWQTTISKRRRGDGCPYCSGKRASKEYNFSVFHPEIARQWNPTKNGNLTPDKVTPSSKKKVWWLCEKGHEWKSAVGNRSEGDGCPYCTGRKASKEYNLSIVHPELAKQWHPKKNGSLTPDKITPHAALKVWWKCEKGHEWQGSINVVSKYKPNQFCPFCAGKRVSKDNNLLAVHPELAKQWHLIKNGNLTPDKVISGSKKKVWWICDKGHEWKALISNRSIGIGCPKCASITPTKEHNLMVIHPDISNQWHPIKNAGLTPEDVTPRSIRKVWWMCEKGHEWEDIIRARTKYGNPCPYCYADRYKEYNLLVLYPNIAVQWHPTKNGQLKPEDVTPGSEKKVWWVCHKEHEWRVSVKGRTSGCNCPYCSGKYPSADYNLLVTNPLLARQWHPTKNGYLKPDNVTPGSNKKVWWVCDKGHEWQAIIHDRTRRGYNCPYCSGRKASKENNLLKIHPEIAKQWHPTKNGDLTPGKITPGTEKKVWWICNKGHEWQAMVYTRSRGSKCPYCAGMKK